VLPAVTTKANGRPFSSVSAWFCWCARPASGRSRGRRPPFCAIGAAIGREFSYALLAAVVGRPDAELEAALNRIVGAGLLFRQGAVLASLRRP
jgi:hypothetical protein